MRIKHFFEETTGTLTYVVDAGGDAVVIDPVRDYEPNSARVTWQQASTLAQYIDDLGLKIHYVIDTHPHADHLSGLPFFKDRYSAVTVTGSGIDKIRRRFAAPTDNVDTETFDILLSDGESIVAGNLQIEALATPGHTPNHMSWKIGDAIFLGDSLFAPDAGTARCDFPEGSAEQLYDSIERLFQYPDSTRAFMAHDYPSGNRSLWVETTIGEQKRDNIHVGGGVDKATFIALREQRDAKLQYPKLFWPSIQVNIQAGDLPDCAANGKRYLTIPLSGADDAC